VRKIEKPKRFHEFRRDSRLIAADEIDDSQDKKMDNPEGVEHAEGSIHHSKATIGKLTNSEGVVLLQTNQLYQPETPKR